MAGMHAQEPLPAPHHRQVYRYYDLVMAAFVTVLLCANLIGASKVATLFGFTFGAGVLFFPISYIFGDVLTEVYGYARSRRVVWAGFAALAAALSAAARLGKREIVRGRWTRTARGSAGSTSLPIGPPASPSGPMWPMHAPRVPPENRPSVIKTTLSPNPMPMIALVGLSISTIPGPPRGPS